MIAKLSMALIYLTTFFNTVVLNCIQPINWQNCKDPHIWLFPELTKGLKMLIHEPCLYCDEQDKINDSIQGS